MRTTPFIWLGSGRAKKRNVGSKGRWLDEAAKARLPVPQGGILLDDFYQILVQEGVVAVEREHVVVPDPIWLSEVLYRDVRFPRLSKAVAVRHAFATVVDDAENPETMPISWHGRCPVQLNVNFQDQQQIAQTLTAAWSAVAPEEFALRRDLLVLEMVVNETAGTAVTHAEHTQDKVWLENRDLTQPPVLEISRLQPFKRSDPQLPPFGKRLQKLLDGIRRTFGKGSWQIDWVDDGKICWLLKISRLSSS